MAHFDDPLRAGAAENVHYVAYAEALLGAYHGGEYLLRDDRGVEILHVRKTEVASAAALFTKLLTEVS